MIALFLRRTSRHEPLTDQLEALLRLTESDGGATTGRFQRLIVPTITTFGRNIRDLV